MHRILYLEHNIDGTVGGSHICLLDICNHLDKSRFQAVVCFFEENSLLDKFRQTGAEIIFHEPPTAWRGYKFLPRLANRLLAIPINVINTLILRTGKWIELLKQHRIDLVHINNACGFDHDLMLACRLKGVPCVIHERGIQTIIDFRSRYFANHSDGIIAISDAVGSNLKHFGIRDDKIIRINDSIDPERLRIEAMPGIIRERFNIPLNSRLIGIVGNIKPWKGQIHVVKAVGLLANRYKDLHCLLVGNVADRQYADEIKHIADNMGATDKIHFTGYQEKPTEIMNAMDIVIHASIEPEPFGIVLLEAMSISKPLIATAHGAPLEIVVDGETGFLTEPGDASSLAEKIVYLLENPDAAERISANAHQRLLDNYTIEHAIGKIETRYEKLLKVNN